MQYISSTRYAFSEKASRESVRGRADGPPGLVGRAMPLPATRRINRNSARDAVHEKLRDWIVRGPLEPGEMIRDIEIADRLGVSRTPVRDRKSTRLNSS